MTYTLFYMHSVPLYLFLRVSKDTPYFKHYIVLFLHIIQKTKENMLHFLWEDC